jgi:SNF2 family DNA or RNA helicase
MRLLTPCPLCTKPLELKSQVSVGAESLNTYKCGHSFIEETNLVDLLNETTKKNYASLTGKKSAFPFQVEGVDFVEKSGYNCLIADPMGLGKTIQAFLAAREGGFKRILVLCKASCGYQWFEESKEWYAQGLWSAFLVKGTSSFLPPSFNVYIMSMDTMSRYAKNKDKFKELKSLDFDLIIVDECHSFKNPESSRSQALVAFLQDISHTEIDRVLRLNCPMCRHTWTENTKIKINLRDAKSSATSNHATSCPQCAAYIRQAVQKDVLETDDRKKLGLILLSGTPIKNRADEYFIPLNLLRPSSFTSLTQFRRTWLQQDPYSGKYNRFLPYKYDEFEYMTRNFIIRREKNSVLSLPEFRRAFETIFIEDPAVKLAYNKELANLSHLMGKANLNFFDVQENLMTLRRITGMAKTTFAIEYVDTFLDTVENEKIAIGIHHESVRDRLYYELQERGFNPLKLSGEDSAERKNQIVQTFTKDPQKRVLIVNMLAGGVGLNLQVCNNVLVLERQWNAADEEQFEGRFHRQGQPLPVLAEYMIAKGTIDEYFSNLVESKRQICGESLDGWDFTSDRESLRDLVAETVSHKL